MNEESRSTVVTGVLAVHVKAIKLTNEEAGASQFKDLMLKISIGDCTKYGLLTPAGSHNGWIVCDSLKYFPISYSISGESDCDSTNDYHFDIELIKWFPLLSTEALLGKTSMKIVNIIQRRVITNSGWRLNDDSELPVADIDMTCVFNYGAFGYGDSNQVVSPYQEPKDYLTWSAFPHLTEEQQLQGTLFNHLIDEDYHPLEDTRSLPHSSLSKQMKNLYKWQLQYGAIRDRSKRLEYLKKIVRSSEASPSARQATMTGIHVRSDRPT